MSWDRYDIAKNVFERKVLMEIVVLLLMFCGLLGAAGFCASFWCMVEIKAMQKSTHQIQYVPVDADAKPETLTTEEKVDPFAVDFDNVI